MQLRIRIVKIAIRFSTTVKALTYVPVLGNLKHLSGHCNQESILSVSILLNKKKLLLTKYYSPITTHHYTAWYLCLDLSH